MSAEPVIIFASAGNQWMTQVIPYTLEDIQNNIRADDIRAEDILTQDRVLFPSRPNAGSLMENLADGLCSDECMENAGRWTVTDEPEYIWVLLTHDDACTEARAERRRARYEERAR